MNMDYTQYQKIIIGALTISFLIICTIYFYTLLYSILFTLLLELGLYSYLSYLKTKVSSKNSPDADSITEPLSAILPKESASSFSRNVIKRKTNIPCLCNSDNFQVLCTGTDKMMTELLTNLKDLMNNDKNFALSLEKNCEKTVIERIQNKNKGFFEDLCKVLDNISKIMINECKELDDSLILGIKLLEKDFCKRHKDLSEKVKKAGEIFSKEIENIKKFTEKMEKHGRTLSNVRSTHDRYANAKNNFEKCLELESKMKILSNKHSKYRHKVQITRDNTLKESIKYLEQIKDLYRELVEINKMKGESHRSYIQCYLTTIQNM